MKRVVTVLVFLVALLAQCVHAQELPFTHYTPENDQNPLPSAAVTDVYQDRMGYIWMAIFSSGLVRYDGHSMERYTTTDGLRALSVWRVLEDSLGRLWVVSDDGLMVSEEPLSAYQHGRKVRFSSKIGQVPLTGDRVRANAVTLDSNGLLWTGTGTHGIIRYRTDDLHDTVVDTILTMTEAEVIPDVRSLLVRQDGSVWVGDARGQLLVLDQNAARYRTVVDRTDPPGQYFTSLYESPSGRLWAGRRDGRLFEMRGSAGTEELVEISTTLKHDILGIHETSDSTLWAVSEGSGILRLNLKSGEERHYGRSSGLLSLSVNSVMYDREGNLWFAQNGGVSKLRFNHDAFQNFSSRSYFGEIPALPAPSIGAVVPSENESSPCSFWAATSEGGIACFSEDGRSTFIQSDKGLRHDWVNALVEDEEGDLWIGTTRGIQRLSFRSGARSLGGVLSATLNLFGKRAQLTGFWPISVQATSREWMRRDGGSGDSVESLWFAGYPYLTFLVDGKWYVFDEPSGLPLTRLHNVSFDASGRLWVATQNQGIYRSVHPFTLNAIEEMRKEQVSMPLERGGAIAGTALVSPVFEQIWSARQGAPTDEFYDLFSLENTVWTATPEGILALEDNPGGEAPIRVVAHLTERDGLDAHFSMSIAYSQQTRTIWVGTNAGLAEIDTATRKLIRTVEKQDGLIDNEVWYIGSVAINSEGTVYYGTAKGLSVYRPQRDKPNSIPPAIHIRHVAYSEKPGANELLAEYAALSFVNEKLVKYKSRLEGYEDEWSAEKSDTKIRYTSLPAFFLPKTYTLEVLAVNDDGVWSETPARYTFRVHPPPWFRWWALLIYLSLIIGGIVAGDQVQRAKLIRQEREKAQIREAELKAEAAVAQSEAAEARARALQAENERKEMELEKAHELELAYDEVRRKHEENERLLLHILPPLIAERLKQGEKIIADSYPDVTILFADLVDFTRLSSQIPATRLVHMLNDLFSEFDNLSITYGVEKIKTIGDAYMAVAGLPEVRDDHAHVMAEVALEMMAVLEQFNKSENTRLVLRIGLNTGPAIAGVIGKHKFIYDLWGDAVNTAARMESHGVPGRIHVSAATQKALDHLFEFDRRGVIEVKGKGLMETYLLGERKQFASVATTSNGKA